MHTTGQNPGAIQKTLQFIHDNQIEFIDFRFTDFRGAWHHMTLHVDAVDSDTLNDGVMIDGSSISGWKSIEDSDMILMPDLDSVYSDPFSRQPNLIIFCTAVCPKTQTGYNRDPRSIALKAQQYLRQTGLATDAFFGPEPEFFVFDEVQYGTAKGNGFYHINADEISSLNGPLFGDGRPRHHHGYSMASGGGYSPVPPADGLSCMRAEMVMTLKNLGISVEKHHHEVAPSQHELGFRFDTLLKTADNVQLYKYVVRGVAHRHGKTATFLPKPLMGENGSGMHVHQSLWRDALPLFLGDGYSHLSDTALYYIGGILKHGRALAAITNPATNSYKRLVPGHEAPVYLAYSANNRSVAVRIPHTPNLKARRIEVRFPDPLMNPYLGLSAMLMAGLDGIENKIHPGDAMECNLYDDGQHDLPLSRQLCRSLTESLDELDRNRSFLTKGNVFDDDMIDAYIRLKRGEVDTVNAAPHPAEFGLYYTL